MVSRRSQRMRSCQARPLRRILASWALLYGLFCSSERVSSVEITPARELFESRATVSKWLIVSAITHEYIPFLRNFACNLRLVGAYDNFVFAALDSTTLRWAAKSGFPVFRVPGVRSKFTLTTPDITFGTDSYKYATKLKSSTTLFVLRQGYSVIFCDPDVIWFKNPFQALIKHGSLYSLHNPGQTVDILIQTDARDLEKPLGSLNSGLYAVKTNVTTLHAFSQIIRNARKSKSSEQPHFKRTLCSFKINYHSCAYVARIGSQNLSAQIDSLPVKSFPNGGFWIYGQTLFDLGPRRFQGVSKEELIAVHNNWIKGIKNKQERQEHWGLWWLDAELRCTGVAVV